MKFKEFIKNLKNRLFNRTKQLPEHIDYYSILTESIDDIELIQNFVNGLSDKLKMKISEYQREKSIQRAITNSNIR